MLMIRFSILFLKSTLGLNLKCEKENVGIIWTTNFINYQNNVSSQQVLVLSQDNIFVCLQYMSADSRSSLSHLLLYISVDCCHQCSTLKISHYLRPILFISSLLSFTFPIILVSRWSALSPFPSHSSACCIEHYVDNLLMVSLSPRLLLHTASYRLSNTT